MNGKNSKIKELDRFKLDLTDKPNLKDPQKNMEKKFDYLLHVEKYQVRVQQK